jgi:magnesium-transporting ATPase (P-type)
MKLNFKNLVTYFIILVVIIGFYTKWQEIKPLFKDYFESDICNLITLVGPNMIVILHFFVTKDKAYRERTEYEILDYGFNCLKLTTILITILTVLREVFIHFNYPTESLCSNFGTYNIIGFIATAGILIHYLYKEYVTYIEDVFYLNEAKVTVEK